MTASGRPRPFTVYGRNRPEADSDTFALLLAHLLQLLIAPFRIAKTILR